MDASHNKRHVVVRTSASAKDFWSRIRDEKNVSPDFRVRHGASTLAPLQIETPFNRQQRPNLPPFTRAGAHPMATSREIERQVLQRALQDAENIPPALQLTRENRKLKTDIARLHRQLRDALQINHALAGAMARNARNDADAN